MTKEQGILRRFGGGVGVTERTTGERLGALEGLRIAGSGPEPEFDGIAALAARIARTPVAAVTFVDAEREWVKAAHGHPLRHVTRDQALGAIVVDQNAPLVIDDTAGEEDLRGNPWIAGEAMARFYTAVPIRVGDVAIGTLAVLDFEPRSADEDLLDGLGEALAVLLPHLQRRREEAMAQNLTSIVGLDARYRRVSPAVTEILGWLPEEMVGRSVMDFLHPGDVERESARIARLTSLEATSGGSESRFRTKDGGYRWLYWTAEHAPHEGVFYAAAKDVTDRKRNEIALRESEARYRMLAENATDMVTGHELDGTVTYASSAGRTLTGWGIGELVGRDLYELVHPEERPAVRAAHRDLIAGREPVRIVSRLARKDGGWQWVETVARLVRDELSEPIGIQAATRDISDTKAAVDALRAARERFRRAFDDAPIGMAIARLDGRFERVNAALCEALGYSEEELVGRLSPLDLAHPDERDEAAAALRHLIDGTHRMVKIERRQVRKDGRVVHLQVTATLLRDSPDAEPRVLGHIEDVTDWHRQAEELDRARETAESADRAKSEFLLRMSHEMRTPLNAMLGFAQLLDDDSLTESQRESVDRMVNGGRHVLKLVNDVLDLSAVESGQVAIAIEPVSVADSVCEAVAMLRPLAAERSIRLSCDCPDCDLLLRTDAHRLKQVLLNLVSNAIKYSGEGAEVTVAPRRVAPGRICIDVIDSGPGIPAEQLESAFEPFERLNAPAKIEGTGLGLPLSRRLVEIMGGTLTAASDASGSRFSVELPLAG